MQQESVWISVNDNNRFDAIENPLPGERIRNISPSYSKFSVKIFKFSLTRNRGWSETNSTYTVEFAHTQNPLLGAIIGGVSSIQAEL